MAQKWNIKTINGSTPPIPMGLKVVRYTLELDSGANMEGTMIHNVVNHKQKFFLVTPPMTETELSAFLAIVKPDELTIVYYDVFNSLAETTGYFYHGDLEVEPLFIKNETMTSVLYKGMSVNLIEN